MPIKETIAKNPITTVAGLLTVVLGSATPIVKTYIDDRHKEEMAKIEIVHRIDSATHVRDSVRMNRDEIYNSDEDDKVKCLEEELNNLKHKKHKCN